MSSELKSIVSSIVGYSHGVDKYLPYWERVNCALSIQVHIFQQRLNGKLLEDIPFVDFSPKLKERLVKSHLVEYVDKSDFEKISTVQ